MNMNLSIDLTWGATHWHWWILGMILLGIEIFAPGFLFLWLGIAAGMVGLILLIDANISWQIQIILYALLSVVSILVWRFWWRSTLVPATDHPTLNRRAEQYLHRMLTLDQPISNGRGRIRVDDSWWSVQGQDLPAGTVVRVVQVDNTTLLVEAVK